MSTAAATGGESGAKSVAGSAAWAAGATESAAAASARPAARRASAVVVLDLELPSMAFLLRWWTPLPCVLSEQCHRSGSEAMEPIWPSRRPPSSPLPGPSLVHPSSSSDAFVRIASARRINGYMDAMAIALLIAAIWTAGFLVIIAACRAAAQGDRAMLSSRRRFVADSHEFRLIA